MTALKKIERFINNSLYNLLTIFLNNKKVDSCKNTENVDRVLFLRYDVLGDMICTYPAMKYLKSKIPNVKIDVMASKSNSFMIENDKVINQIYNFDGKILSNIKFLFNLRKNKYDVIFATYYINLTKNGILANIIGIKNTIKVNVYDKEKRYLFFNFQSKIAESKSIMFEKMYYLVVDYIGKANEFERLSLSIPRKSESKIAVSEYLESNQIEKFIVINLSSGKENRKWSIDKIMELINSENAKKWDFSFVITAMGKDLLDAERIARNTKNTYYFGERSIFDMIELVDSAELVLTPDTSIVHICSIVKTKVCVFTFQDIVDEGVWVPYEVSHRLLISQVNFDMKQIPTEKVIASMEDLLNE